ncbi:Coq4 family protein [Cyanobium sp. Morenito 9A2]|uniref:Coq4 family protein n=1 Tax=Cyanobium sp. Morenito 9A2 TaxID=2823718 RepID=UPI0020CCD695|nr:Coq4 family protein [Cyanobium sp. Morenito 9A2]MCP9849389.1 hypothetical protein [Cyanobium sp. Morenito 9A2]
MEINSELKLELLETLKGFMHFVQDPRATTSVFEIQRGLSHQAISMKNVEHMLAQPGIQQLADERYQPQRPSLTTLLLHPPGTLGHAYASSLLSAGFDPDFFEVIEVIGKGTYLDLRVRQTHDIWHVMTGFGTDLAGELGLQAFQLCQIYSPLSILIVAAGVLHAMGLGAPIEPLLRAIEAGIEIAATDTPMLAVRWEEHWGSDLDELRAGVGLRTARYEPYSV